MWMEVAATWTWTLKTTIPTTPSTFTFAPAASRSKDEVHSDSTELHFHHIKAHSSHPTTTHAPSYSSRDFGQRQRHFLDSSSFPVSTQRSKCKETLPKTDIYRRPVIFNGYFFNRYHMLLCCQRLLAILSSHLAAPGQWNGQKTLLAEWRSYTPILPRKIQFPRNMLSTRYHVRFWKIASQNVGTDFSSVFSNYY